MNVRPDIRFEIDYLHFNTRIAYMVWTLLIASEATTASKQPQEIRSDLRFEIRDLNYYTCFCGKDPFYSFGGHNRVKTTSEIKGIHCIWYHVCLICLGLFVVKIKKDRTQLTSTRVVSFGATKKGIPLLQSYDDEWIFICFVLSSKHAESQLTLKGVNTDFLAQKEGVFYLLLLDALNAEARERDGHSICRNLEGAHSLV